MVQVFRRLDFPFQGKLIPHVVEVGKLTYAEDEWKAILVGCRSFHNSSYVHLVFTDELHVKLRCHGDGAADSSSPAHNATKGALTLRT